MRSEWREFAFALHQVQNVIEPHVRLTHVLKHWNRMAKVLAERQRKRENQNRKLQPKGDYANAY